MNLKSDLQRLKIKDTFRDNQRSFKIMISKFQWVNQNFSMSRKMIFFLTSNLQIIYYYHKTNNFKNHIPNRQFIFRGFFDTKILLFYHRNLIIDILCINQFNFFDVEKQIAQKSYFFIQTKLVIISSIFVNPYEHSVARMELLLCMQYKLELSFWNWKKENNQSLCDFKEISKQPPHIFKFQGTGIIYRNTIDFDLQFVPIKKVSPTGDLQKNQPLILVRQINQTYKITDLKNSHKTEEPLLVLASTLSQKSQKSLVINQGSLIKVGKTIIQVLKIQAEIQPMSTNLYKKHEKSLIESIKKISLSNYQILQDFQNINQNFIARPTIVSVKEQQEQIQSPNKIHADFSIFVQNPMCKICFSRTIEKGNSLISLCKCKGSSKFIHQKCIGAWVKARSEQTSFEKQGKKSIFRADIKGFKCQVCKQYYPIDYIHKLILEEHHLQVSSYMALKIKYDDKQQFYVIDLNQVPQIKIGRDLESDIMIGEITVSRNHCIIKYDSKRQQVQIIDLNSKFGTSMKKPSFFLNQSLHRLQKGRTCMQINKVKNSQKSNIFNKILFCLPQAY